MLLTRWETLPSLQSTANGAFPLHGTVRYGSLLQGFSNGYCTWYFFSTTSARVPSDPYRYMNVTCKLCWSLIGRRKFIIQSLLRHWTCDTRPNIDPLDLNQHSQLRIGRNFCLNKCTFLYQPKNVCFVVCWGSTDVPLVDSRGADPSILIDLSIAVKNIHMPRMKNTIPSICFFVVSLFVARLGWCHCSRGGAIITTRE